MPKIKPAPPSLEPPIASISPENPPSSNADEQPSPSLQSGGKTLPIAPMPALSTPTAAPAPAQSPAQPPPPIPPPPIIHQKITPIPTSAIPSKQRADASTETPNGGTFTSNAPPPDWLVLASTALQREVPQSHSEPDDPELQQVHAPNGINGITPTPIASPPHAPHAQPTLHTTQEVFDHLTEQQPVETVEQLRARLTRARMEVDQLERKVRTLLPPRRGNERLAVSVMRRATAQQPKTKAMLPQSRMPILLEQLKRGSYRIWT